MMVAEPPAACDAGPARTYLSADAPARRNAAPKPRRLRTPLHTVRLTVPATGRDARCCPTIEQPRHSATLLAGVR